MATISPVEVERVSLAVVRALEDRPRQDMATVLDDFPSGACDATSYALGVVFHELGLGDDWWHITMADPQRSWAHTWLELRDRAGRTLLVVDATVQQFADLASSPYVGLGPSPATRRYSRPSKCFPCSETPAYEVGVTEREALRVAREALGLTAEVM